MIHKTSIAALLRSLDQESPAGFAIALHIQFTSPRYLFQTYPKRWMDHYSAKGLVVHDPTVRWGLQNVGQVRWAELERIDTEGVLEQARAHGIMNGVTVSVLEGGSRTIASFARSDRDYSEPEAAELAEALTALHETTLDLHALGPDERQAFTELSIRSTHA